MPSTRSCSPNIVKILLLLLFCFAQFLDTFNSSAFFSAIPSISSSLSLEGNHTIWLVSAYQLTFASFLLCSGRISDVYNPKIVFITGISTFGAFSLASGFLRNKVAFLVFRAIIGIAASLTIPSALHLIVHLYPEPSDQARAIGFFNGSVALGNVLGLVLGALFVQLASWNWIFYFEAMVALPIAIICVFLLPSRFSSVTKEEEPSAPKPTGLDLVGVTLLTVSLLLFILAVTSGSTSGWNSPIVIAPLTISLALFVAFVWWETRIPPMKAALPPQVWFYKNFSILFAVALFPMMWWTAVFFAFSTLWQDTYKWSPISSAVHLLPIGILGIAVMTTSGRLSTRFSAKSIIITGQSLVIIATTILPFANRPSRYWPYVFPAFCIGTSGTALIFTQSNIAILSSAPSQQSGTVGAVYNAALQLGSAIGVAAFTSLQANIDKRSNSPWGFAGRSAGFWLLLGICVVESIAVVLFYRSDRVREETTACESEIGRP